MHRTTHPIQVNDGIMGGLAANVSVPIHIPVKFPGLEVPSMFYLLYFYVRCCCIVWGRGETRLGDLFATTTPFVSARSNKVSSRCEESMFPPPKQLWRLFYFNDVFIHNRQLHGSTVASFTHTVFLCSVCGMVAAEVRGWAAVHLTGIVFCSANNCPQFHCLSLWSVDSFFLPFHSRKSSSPRIVTWSMVKFLQRPF